MSKQADGNIKTFLRIRPSKKPSGYFQIDDMDKSSILFALPDNFRSDFINNTKLKHSYHFNGILDASVTQDDVFKIVGSSAVQNAIDGFNSTIFAYGQTGSGKTFTLTGGPGKYSDRGLIPRSISMLFNEFRNRTDVQFKAYVSYLELYNEQGYDLLDPSHETKALEDLPKVSMLEDEHGNFHLKNLSMHPTETEEDALNLLFLGDTNRAIAETPMNMASSRSHCIFSLALEARLVGSDKVRRSKLHLVDLAGSERVAKTNSSGSVLTEARYINTSLFFLEMVIVALYEKATKGRSHIPYRNSMMTSVLRDSLGGNCKTIMIATINPEASHTEESLSTCKFAQRVSLIKNKASINEEMDPSLVIRRLKTEVLTLREEISFLKGESGEGEILNPQQIEDLKAQCRTYCFDPDPHSTLNIGALTLTKIKDVFAIFKNLVLESHANRTNNGESPMLLDGPPSSRGKSSDNSGGNEDFMKQIRDLKSLLQQRDSEINILVNMVKKGKTAEDVGAARRSSMEDRSGYIENFGDKFSRSGGNTPQSFEQQQGFSGKAREEQREKENQQRIIKRHLFGVPPPPDRKVFDDAAASFEWFRDHCSLNAALEENKDILKNKIAEAKLLGERANQSRNTINYLKNSIEAIRRERALQRLGDNENDMEDQESEEETTHRRAIEQEKSVYKESFDKLRVLKPEIEHVRKVLEKCRMNMQNQFDQWYSNLHTRGGETVLNAAAAHNSAYMNSGPSSASSEIQPGFPSSSQVSRPGSSRDLHQQSYRPQRDLTPHSSLSTQDFNRLRENKGETDFKREKDGFSRPMGGNDSINMAESKVSQDEEVNEDIMAFYQAKEELLKRRGGR